MAPGRKKGSSTLKAAAVRREWNVGELVLAKVKGYPPWPAQISRAEENGWAPIPNKIFVCFFGTKQIRFCHYNEVLPFTPRERSSLIGKLQQKHITADFSRAIKEICKADDEQKDENQVEMDDGVAENDGQQEDGNLSHADDKLGATDVEGSDGRPESHPASPGTRSSDDRSVPRVGRKEHSEAKPDGEPDQDIAKAITGNDGHRFDDGKPRDPDASTAVGAEESNPSQVSVKGGDSFDADQVHYYRKKVRKIVKEEKPQEVAPRVEKQQTPPITESPKGGAQPRRAAFGKALKKLNQSLEKSVEKSVERKPPQHGGRDELKSGASGDHFPKKKYKQRRFKNRGLAMRNGGAAGSSKLRPDMEYDGVGLESPLQKKGQRFGKEQSKSFSRGGVHSQIQSDAAGSEDDEERDADLCVENRLVDETLERTDSPALTSSPVSASGSDGALLKAGRNQGRGRLGVGRGRRYHYGKKGNSSPTKGRADISKTDDSDEAKESENAESENAESDYDDKDYEYGKSAELISDRRKKRVHKPTKAYFKSSKKAKTAGGSIPREGNTALKSADMSLKDMKVSDSREKGTSLPPKAAKYRIRSSLPDDEAVLPPSKRWHPAFEAVSASEVEVAATHGGEPGNTKTAVVPGVQASQDGSEQKQNTANAKGGETKFTPRKGMPAPGKSCSLSKAAVFTADVLDSSHLTKLPSTEADGKEVSKKEKVGDGKPSGKVSRGNSLPATKVGGSGHLTKGQTEKVSIKGVDHHGKGSSEKPVKLGGTPKAQSDKPQVKTYKARKPLTSPRKESTGAHSSPEPKRVEESHHAEKKSQEGSLKQSVLSSQLSTPGKGTPGTPGEKGKGFSSGPSSDAGRINGVKLEGFTSPVKLRHDITENKLRQALETAKETKQKSLQGDGSTSSMSLKYLIAAANAKRQAKQMPAGGDHTGNVSDKAATGLASSPSPVQGRESSRLVSPVQPVSGVVPQGTPKSAGPSVDFMSPNGGKGEAPRSAGGRNGKDRQPSGSREGGSGAESTEAAVARDTFTGMLETLSRTKESIGRASHHALECVKHGIADQIVEIIVEKLENEPSFHRRVDLFFLVDSITQCSHTSKGTTGAVFPPIVKDALPRLLNAAAPPGSSARENRRQCLKVLKLWLERGILPEQTLRHFMSEIEAHNDEKMSGGNSRRPSRSERAVDDPLREMDGMFVDEYGSNASFALPGLLIPRMFEDDEEGSEGDGGKQSDKEEIIHLSLPEEVKEVPVPTEGEKQEEVDKHCLVLEAVDGELEMEDVSPSEHDSKARMEEAREESPPRPPSSPDGQAAAVSDVSESSMGGSPQPPLPQGPPPPPADSPPSPPPLPASPPPSPPPPPPSPPATTAEEPSPVQSHANHSQLNLPAVQNFMPVGKPQLRETEQPRPGIFAPFTPQPIQVSHSVVGPSYGSSAAFPNAQASARPNGPNLANPMPYANLGPPLSQGLAPTGPPSAYAAAHAKHLAQSAAHAQHVAQAATHLHVPHNSHLTQTTAQVPRMQNVVQGSVHVPQTSPHIPQNTAHAPPLPLGNPGFSQRPYMQPLKPLHGGPHQSSTQFGVDQEKVSPHLRRVIQDDQLRQSTERPVESGLGHAEGRPMPAAGGSALPTEGHISGESPGGAAQFLPGSSSFHPPDQVYRMNKGMMRPSHVTPPYSSGHGNMPHPIVPQPFSQPPFRHSTPMQGNIPPGNMSMLVPSPTFQYNASVPGAMPQGGTVPPPPQGQHILNFRPGGPTPAQWRPS